MSISSVGFTNSDRLDNNLCSFGLEFLDYIPMVSIASGVARLAFGMLQTVAAPIKDVVSFVDFYSHPSGGSSIDNGTSLYVRGRANMIRGSTAMWPILGNITLYLYDHSSLAKDWERHVAGINAATIWVF